MTFKTKTKTVLTFVALLASFVFFSFARAETLKIGFVTDWEYGTAKEYDHKLPRSAEKYLNAAVTHYNRVFHPDMAVGGGDYILSRHVSKKKAAKQLRHINNVFAKTNAPRLYCIGNHDLGNLSEAEVEKNLGINGSHSVTDAKGVRIVTLDTNNPVSSSKGDDYGMTGKVTDEELAWLDEHLRTDLPVIVFSHHSPVQTPNGKNWRINIIGAERVRNVLEKYSNVVAVFSGHDAINYRTEISGINYVIVNNLSDKNAKGSFADIGVDKSGNDISVSVSQYGRKPATYNFSKTLTIN